MASHPVPYRPLELRPEICSALQAMMRGECPAEAQPEIVEWMINEVCATYDQSYMGEDTHDTAFMEGRRWCGNTLIKALKTSPGRLAARIDQIKHAVRSKP